MRIKALSKREKLLLLLVLVLVLGFSGYHYVYLPLREELEILEVSLQEKKRGLAQGRELLAQLDEIEGKQRQFEKSYREFFQLLPAGKELPSLLLQLEGVLTAEGVSLLSFQPLGVEEKDGFSVYSFNLTIAGEYGEIISFLDALEQLPRFVNMVAADLIRTDTSGRIRADLKLQVFYLPGTEQVVVPGFWESEWESFR